MAMRLAARQKASTRFLDAGAILEALKEAGGAVRLLSARWLLARAGFERVEFRKTGKWERKGAPTPLPCRQLLEVAHPEAYLSTEALQGLHEGFVDVLKGTKHAVKDGLSAAPLVALTHCWYTPQHADPQGSTLMKLCEELGRQLPLMEPWGLKDIGVFFDWASLYQDTLDAARTPEQQALYAAALPLMPMLFAHKQTTVFVISVQETIAPPRGQRGWPLYEEALLRLFKEVPAPKRYTVPDYGQCHLWPKLVRVGEADAAASYAAQGPPLAPLRFNTELTPKVFSREEDRDVVVADYRKTIESGLAGLSELMLQRRGWGDEELITFAGLLREVEMPHVRVLDLSSNDMTTKGLEALCASFAAGALHSLEVLNLSQCSGILALPEALVELRQLHTIKLDGCIGLASIPESFARMAALKTFSIINCLRLISAPGGLHAVPAAVRVVKEEKKTKKKKE